MHPFLNVLLQASLLALNVTLYVAYGSLVSLGVSVFLGAMLVLSLVLFAKSS